MTVPSSPPALFSRTLGHTEEIGASLVYYHNQLTDRATFHYDPLLYIALGPQHLSVLLLSVFPFTNKAAENDTEAQPHIQQYFPSSLSVTGALSPGKTASASPLHLVFLE